MAGGAECLPLTALLPIYCAGEDLNRPVGRLRTPPRATTKQAPAFEAS